MRYLKVSILLGMVLLLALNIVPYRLSGNMPSSADVIRRCPEPIRTGALAQGRKHQSKLPSGDAFEKLNGISDREGWWHGDKEKRCTWSGCTSTASTSMP